MLKENKKSNPTKLGSKSSSKHGKGSKMSQINKVKVSPKEADATSILISIKRDSESKQIKSPSKFPVQDDKMTSIKTQTRGKKGMDQSVPRMKYPMEKKEEIGKRIFLMRFWFPTSIMQTIWEVHQFSLIQRHSRHLKVLKLGNYIVKIRAILDCML